MTQIKEQNLAFIDVEMTGLNPDLHEILSVGVVLVRQEWARETPSFEIIEELELKVKPEHIQNADPVSLKVNKYDPVDWTSAISLKEAMEILSKKTEGAIMVGHNVAFDYLFLDKAFRRAGYENKMHYHKLDTVSIAFAKLHGNKDIGRFSLQNLTEHFKIENKNIHTALGDARATLELYKKLMSL